MRILSLALAGTILFGSSTSIADDNPEALPHVEVFSSGEGAIFSNAYLIHTRSGLVVVDATLLESSSRALRARIDASGKPLRAVLITHGHPDHYNGITNLVAGSPQAEIIATSAVDRVIRTDDAAKEQQWRPVFGDEWPRHRTFPNRIFRSGQSYEIDGLRLTVHDLGPGESHADSYWMMETGGKRFAFIGDAVLNHVHAYVSDAHTTEWLRNLAVLAHELRDVEVIYPGHGAAGGLGLLDFQRDYLRLYRRLVRQAARGGSTLPASEKAELATRMIDYLGNSRLAFLIGLGADAVAAELASRGRDRSSEHAAAEDE